METRKLARSEWPGFFLLNVESEWGHVFNGPAWLGSIGEIFAPGGEVEIFGVFDRGRLVAGLPMWRPAGSGEGEYGLGPFNFPATPWSGLTIGRQLLERHPRDEAVHGAAAAVAGHFSACRSAFILHPPEMVDIRPFIEKGWKVRVKFDYRLDLAAPGGPGSLLSPAMREMVARAARKGARLRLSADEDLFARLWRSTYGGELVFGLEEEKGRRHFRALVSGGTARFHACSDESGKTTCAWLVLVHGRKMYGYGTLNLEGADDLYTWMRLAVLEEYRREGFTDFYWCGANVYSRMAFKRDFNPRLVSFFGCAREGGG